MTNLIVYGSLMSAGEVERLQLVAIEMHAVSVAGFRRSFSQEPSWRQGVGNQRGVLTVELEETAWLNAVLLTGVSDSATKMIEKRECGYERTCVSTNSICTFNDGQAVMPHVEASLFVGRPNLFNSQLQPNPEYLRLCLDAAREWGEEFFDQFCRTTFIGETSLAEIGEVRSH